MSTAAPEMVAPLATLSLDPGPAEIAGAFWTCCGVEVSMSDADRSLSAYSGWAIWPGVRCSSCGGAMAIGSRPVPKAKARVEEPGQHLKRAEVIARHKAAKRADELLRTDAAEPARTLDEAKRRLLPFGDPEYVGKPLGELPHVLLNRVRRWANAKKRRDRFASLLQDIDLVLGASSDDFEAEPAGLFDTTDDMEFAS